MTTLNAQLDMTEAQFRALPREALMLLEGAGARREFQWEKATGACWVVIHLPAELMPRLLAACQK